MPHFATLLNRTERTDSEKGRMEIPGKDQSSALLQTVRRKSFVPEIYLAVDDDQEEQREDAVYDQVGVSQVNLIFWHI